MQSEYTDAENTGAPFVPLVRTAPDAERVGHRQLTEETVHCHRFRR